MDNAPSTSPFDCEVMEVLESPHMHPQEHRFGVGSLPHYWQTPGLNDLGPSIDQLRGIFDGFHSEGVSSEISNEPPYIFAEVSEFHPVVILVMYTGQ